MKERERLERIRAHCATYTPKGRVEDERFEAIELLIHEDYETESPAWQYIHEHCPQWHYHLNRWRAVENSRSRLLGAISGNRSTGNRIDTARQYSRAASAYLSARAACAHGWARMRREDAVKEAVDTAMAEDARRTEEIARGMMERQGFGVWREANREVQGADIQSGVLHDGPRSGIAPIMEAAGFREVYAGPQPSYTPEAIQAMMSVGVRNDTPLAEQVRAAFYGTWPTGLTTDGERPLRTSVGADGVLELDAPPVGVDFTLVPDGDCEAELLGSGIRLHGFHIQSSELP